MKQILKTKSGILTTTSKVKHNGSPLGEKGPEVSWWLSSWERGGWVTKRSPFGLTKLYHQGVPTRVLSSCSHTKYHLDPFWLNIALCCYVSILLSLLAMLCTRTYVCSPMPCTRTHTALTCTKCLVAAALLYPVSCWTLFKQASFHRINHSTGWNFLFPMDDNILK